MRLIVVDSVVTSQPIEFREFIGREIPEYVILSHTWGDDEVSLEDAQTGRAEGKKGYEKIVGLCRQARIDGYQYAWIDTCCIDKKSSSELQEAINSMYRWYADSQICYVYLEDVAKGRTMMEELRKCRWVKRGWTLQELIAPRMVEFYDSNWMEIGTKLSLHKELSSITRIKPDILLGDSPKYLPVAERMSWASERVTTRLEDEAYCLMGLFEINMPMLYGEGERAFLRLQEEIMKKTDDSTIFLWRNAVAHGWDSVGMLADSPVHFKHFPDGFKPVKWYAHDQLTEAPHFTGRGLKMHMPLIDCSSLGLGPPRILPGLPRDPPYMTPVALKPIHGTNQSELICIRVLADHSDPNHFRRHQPSNLVHLPNDRQIPFQFRPCYALPSGYDGPRKYGDYIPDSFIVSCEVAQSIRIGVTDPTFELHNPSRNVSTLEVRTHSGCYTLSATIICPVLGYLEIESLDFGTSLHDSTDRLHSKLFAIFGWRAGTPWCSLVWANAMVTAQRLFQYELIQAQFTDRVVQRVGSTNVHLSVKRNPTGASSHEGRKIHSMKLKLEIEPVEVDDLESLSSD